MEARGREELGEWEEAAAIYQRVVDRISNLPERRRPADSDLNLDLAASAAGLVRALTRGGDIEAAQRLCEQLELWDAEDADLWRLRVHAVSRIHQGLVDEGLAGLQQLADSDPPTSTIGIHWPTRQSTRGPKKESLIDKSFLSISSSLVKIIPPSP